MTKTRVLMIEDNRLYGEGAAELLNAQPDIRAIALGGVHDSMMQRAVEFKPHVVLLDGELLRIVHRIRAEISKVHFIATDLVPGSSQILRCVKEGVSGLLHKDATVDDCLSTIRSVAKGQKVLPANLSAALFAQIIEEAVRTNNPELVTRAIRMTPRENEIMELVALGRCNKEIAQELFLSVHTVKSHIHNILDKLALHTRLELAHFVIWNRKETRALSDASLSARLLNPTG
jgi:DNA-binding NarL/FixJ family response regulator